MLITNTNYTMSFGALIPANKYKGPLLKLTKEDKTKIAALQEDINRIELEHYKINQYIQTKKNLSFNVLDILYTQSDRLEYRIEQLKNMIREIKMNRLKTQKDALK